MVPDVKNKKRRTKTGSVALAMSVASAMQMASVKCDGTDEEQSSCWGILYREMKTRIYNILLGASIQVFIFVQRTVAENLSGERSEKRNQTMKTRD